MFFMFRPLDFSLNFSFIVSNPTEQIAMNVSYFGYNHPAALASTDSTGRPSLPPKLPCI